MTRRCGLWENMTIFSNPEVLEPGKQMLEGTIASFQPFAIIVANVWMYLPS